MTAYPSDVGLKGVMDRLEVEVKRHAEVPIEKENWREVKPRGCVRR